MNTVAAGNTEAIISLLGLQPHPEGGHYRRIHTASTATGSKPALSVIHYLLQRGEKSRWHVLHHEEVWHYLDGDPLELITFNRAVGELVLHRLEPGPSALWVVPAGVWQAARPLGRHTLCTCSVAPAFDVGAFSFVADVADHLEAFEGPLSAYRDLL